MFPAEEGGLKEALPAAITIVQCLSSVAAAGALLDTPQFISDEDRFRWSSIIFCFSFQHPNTMFGVRKDV
jgi:hypothetical protein